MSDISEGYAAAYERLGSYRAVAREFNVVESTVRLSLKRRARRLDPGITDALERTGISVDTAKFGYRRVKDQDGSFNTVFWRLPQEEQESVLDRIREAMSDVEALPEITAPAFSDTDLMTLYPIADAHIGMQAWGRETGEDYDTKLATKRLRDWVGQVVDLAPASETAVILGVGDLLHADDQTNMTPNSKHVLDTDTRHYKTLEATIEAMKAAIEYAAQKHRRVLVRILPGNHDKHAYIAVLMALANRYEGNDRIKVQSAPNEFFVQQFGKVMLAAHHGDKAKADRMVHFLADEYAEIWGKTRHRFLWTGHLHHHKSQDIGGVQWEQLRAMTAKDAYAASHAYSARAQMQAITYHRDKGEIQRVKVGL
jgi:hypothetical protein